MIIVFNDQGDTLSVQEKIDSNSYKIINYKNNQPDNFKTFINDQKHGDWLYKNEDTTFLGVFMTPAVCIPMF